MVIVQGLYTRLGDEFAVDVLLLDEGLERVEVGQFKMTDRRVLWMYEEKGLAMASILDTISQTIDLLEGMHLLDLLLPSTPHALPAIQH